MTADTQPFYDTLNALGPAIRDPVPVTLSPELIGLLSEQLYRSPAKAIEELVVNAYDADADEVRVFVASETGGARFVAVYDNGHGMTYDGLADLWRVGRTKQRTDLQKHATRKQIGKFGIGKLSTYTIANRVTYITSNGTDQLGVTIDYRDFRSTATSTTTEVKLRVHRIDNFDSLLNDDMFRQVLISLQADANRLRTDSWTIVILEELKEKARQLSAGRLRWVLRTAMPLGSRFNIVLNGEELESSKADYAVLVEFDVADIPKERLIGLRKKTKETWSVVNGKLTSPSFPSGISGKAVVTEGTLTGKSGDLFRSEGFFVYVRGRLVNEEDALFGLHKYSHATWNRFHADIYADDLDVAITANRESMEDVKVYRDAQAVLNEVFNEARTRYRIHATTEEQKALGQREHTRNYVPERLVELPTADVLAGYAKDPTGAEADESWMYLTVDPTTNVQQLISTLYASGGRERKYRYQYAAFGSAERLVRYAPDDETFTINEDHDLTRAYGQDPRAADLLNDLATSEALLEVYLREAGLNPHTIGEVLEKRDLLFRGLANAKMFSLDALSTYVRDSAAVPLELEIALVAGARALGFVAKHLGGPGEPDGVARFTDYPGGEQKITLEAKSSQHVPRTRDIDFAALREHMEELDARGCLLVAPGYQGDTTSNAAKHARKEGISCWTVEQFAAVVAAAESRHITARQILGIVREKFAQEDVSTAVEDLLAEPRWETPDLYRAVLAALRALHGRLRDTPRTIELVMAEVSRMTDFQDIPGKDIEKAIKDMVPVSQGGLLLRTSGEVVLNVDYDELERRIQAFTRKAGRPRREGAFGETTRSRAP